MKNITLSADDTLIEAARQQARADNSTLNEQFRLWLASYTQRRGTADKAMAVIEAMQKYVDTGGRKFTRDDMNER